MSVEHLALVQELAGIGIWEWDVATGEAQYSPQWCALLGIDPANAPTTSAAGAELIHPDDRARAEAAARRAVEGRAAEFEVEHRMRHASGGWRWMRARGTVMARDASGVGTRIVGMHMDITDERRSAAEIASLTETSSATAAELRALLEVVPGSFAIVEPGEARFVAFNDTAHLSLGYTREEFAQLSIMDLDSSTDRERVLSFVRANMEKTGRQQFRRRHVARDGSLRDVLVSSLGFTSRGKRFAYVIWLDITEQGRVEESLRESERALRQSEERYALAARAASHVVWDWNLRTGWIEWGAAITERFGYAGGQIDPAVQWWNDRVHPEDRSRVNASLHAVIDARTAGHEWQDHYRFRRADGTYAEVVDRGYVARNADGEAVRVIGAMEDVTAQLQLEARLRQSQKMEAIGQLAGGVAHDFNNLLTVIGGNLDVAERETQKQLPAGVAVHEALGEIRDASRRAAELVKRLLTFSRQQPVTQSLVRLGDQVTATEALLRRVIGEEINLRVQIAEEPMHIWADRGELEQVLLNLAVNARDAMLNVPDRSHLPGGTLTIRASAVEFAEEQSSGWSAAVPPGRYALLEVRDTGHGMDADTQARLFEPFFTTKEVGKGTGLGLATVYGIVRTSGGTIGVTSAPGAGATFRILWPAISGARSESPSGEDTAASAVASHTILLVEDESAVRRTIKRMLERQGHRVVEASDGVQALACWEAEREAIDVVITDLRMPRLGGVEVMERLHLASPSLPVIVMSGYGTSPEDVAEHAGQGYLEKPFSDAVLRTALRRVEGRGGGV